MNAYKPFNASTSPFRATVTDFVIYWLLVSVVHQMNIFLRKNVPDIT